MHSTAQPQRLSCMGQNSNIYELWKQWNFKLIIIRQKVEAYETSWAGLTIDPARFYLLRNAAKKNWYALLQIFFTSFNSFLTHRNRTKIYCQY